MGAHAPGLGRDRRPAVERAGRAPGRRAQVIAGRELRFRGPTEPPGEPTPLPPLRPLPASGSSPEPATALAAAPSPPNWSPLAVALPLFAAVWVVFTVLAARVTAPAAADVTALGEVLAVGAAVVALVLVTLAVAHLQVSGRWPRPAAGAVIVLGLGQGALATTIGSGSDDFWGVAAWVFVLVGVAVPLAWVGGQFQSGVRRQRVERHASLAASWIERARRQAHQTVQSVHRHDVRSMLFVVDGAARTLSDPNLSAEQRRGFAEMLAESVQRLGELIDVRAEEIQPFAFDGVARAVAQAERRAGRTVRVDVASPLTAVGRAADVAAVLRTLLSVTGRKTGDDLLLRSDVVDSTVLVWVEPVGSEDLALLAESWEEIRVESFKPTDDNDDESIDLYVATRLLAEQGCDLWSAAGRSRFAVRLPAADTSSQEEE
ncbi:MAG: hypothetical protein AB1679_28620 [Actinomycetota bacterium]|jgi:hypothetical protein